MSFCHQMQRFRCCCCFFAWLCFIAVVQRASLRWPFHGLYSRAARCRPQNCCPLEKHLIPMRSTNKKQRNKARVLKNWAKSQSSDQTITWGDSREGGEQSTAFVALLPTKKTNMGYVIPIDAGRHRTVMKEAQGLEWSQLCYSQSCVSLDELLHVSEPQFPYVGILLMVSKTTHAQAFCEPSAGQALSRRKGEKERGRNQSLYMEVIFLDIRMSAFSTIPFSLQGRSLSPISAYFKLNC